MLSFITNLKAHNERHTHHNVGLSYEVRVLHVQYGQCARVLREQGNPQSFHFQACVRCYHGCILEEMALNNKNKFFYDFTTQK